MMQGWRKSAHLQLRMQFWGQAVAWAGQASDRNEKGLEEGKRVQQVSVALVALMMSLRTCAKASSASLGPFFPHVYDILHGCWHISKHLYICGMLWVSQHLRESCLVPQNETQIPILVLTELSGKASPSLKFIPREVYVRNLTCAVTEAMPRRLVRSCAAWSFCGPLAWTMHGVRDSGKEWSKPKQVSGASSAASGHLESGAHCPDPS